MEPFKRYFVYSLQQHIREEVEAMDNGPFPAAVERTLGMFMLERRLGDLVLEAQARGVRDALDRSCAASDPKVSALAESLGFESITITWVIWDPTTYCRLDVPGFGCVTGHAIRNGEKPNGGRAMAIALHRAVREMFYIAARRELVKTRRATFLKAVADRKARRAAKLVQKSTMPTLELVPLPAVLLSDGGREDLDHPVAVDSAAHVEEEVPF